MKKIFLITSCILIGYHLGAQTQLWGMTNGGGQYAGGVIFKTDGSGNNHTVQYNFDGATNGVAGVGSLLQTSDGMLYGMTYSGGANGMGVIFQYDPVASVYSIKFDFDGVANGSNPWGSLIQASDGKFYGMTRQGGANNMGVIFQYNPITSTYSKKFDFDGAINGGYPYGLLIQASDGKLYGMTRNGGSGIGVGVLFQYDPATSTYTKKFDFGGANGYSPFGSLIQASDGMLYGMTSQGGNLINSGKGVLFQYNLATSNYTKKVVFDSINGESPLGNLIQGSDGMLYGMTAGGGADSGGVIFQYDPSTSSYTKKFDFDTGANGNTPMGSLLQASDGMMYGMTQFRNGINDSGAIFQYDPITNIYTKKLDLTWQTGIFPAFNSLIEIPVSITTASLSVNSCLGDSINVAYTLEGAYDTSNVFTAQLSDSLGSFLFPVNIGSIASTNVGSINAVVPSLNTVGSAYKIRVISSSPAIIGNDVTFNSSPDINLGNDTTICQGQTVILSADSGNSYLWSNGLITSSINVSTSGTYWLQANNGQCSNTDTIMVTVVPIVLTTVGTMVSDNTICAADSVTLTGIGASSFLWSSGSTDSVITVSNSGTYWVQDNSIQCSNKDSITVSISNCETEMEVPNIFTPNNDGINDLFTITTKNIITLNCKIYNRWGILVGELKTINEVWDGYTTSGQKCTEGVYYWIVEYQNSTGTNKLMKGFVQLVR